MNRIKELREEKHITQIRLSIDLEVSQETISAYEKGKYYPSAKSLIKLADIFGVSIDYLLGISDIRMSVDATNLKPYERKLLSLTQNMDAIGREKLISYAEGYLDGK
ncbi:DNA-binding helix-turn-helix protein [Marvinbryantia formatexigens DSM 14469]|uniref:DNA-binding helix-turn-helix protein n=1 Tax=Marvinbryantia formatexigens DSM 14469 TaxID=478749 RepID=C6LAE4_9FIRM|nr:helix-turn-helix transcriptional regulator [Marvinbryantia formatexigens]EET62551.1 DNA-binding helix-turn-helix protein [Marvinbryantia formatexigens DSM 14469]UWO24929.1 helix-turn-helix domain-containing protein [Marvinbryantia formatexigens DSM 14469]SDG24169.1 DNA-binding transcriptional regulator, XRE-family HTH domain [Marvinbryantia formatexigens]